MAQINRKTSIWGKMVARVINGRLRKSQQSLINETYNPLFNVSGKEAQMIFDFARSGSYAQLQYLYNEIEKRDPTLLTCVTRRSAAISELDWKVVRSDERLTRNADKNLIQEQIECLETTIAKIENLPEALEHLGLFSFRGYSHISPVLNFDGSIKRFDLPDSWNFCFDRTNQKWLWNPDATSFTLPKEGSGNLQSIPSEELVSVVGNNAIDWPALFIFLRMAVGERDWGRFVETYGLPPVIITMPEFTSEQDQQNYMTAAEDVFEGKSGVIPFGSQVNYGSESRGTEPFSQFLEHQQKLIVLMATGGTLTSLAESGSGTLGGNAQMDVWKQIVRRDVRRISNAFNMQLCANVLKKEFKGKPILAEFQLDTTPKPTADEILDLAGKAASAGFEMDENELSQATGYTIRKKKEDGGFGGGGGFDIPPSPTPPDDEPPPTGTDGGGANDGDGDDIDSQLKNLDAIATPKADVVNVDEGFADINENIAKTRSNAEQKTPIQSDKESIANADTPEKSRFTAQEKLARSLQADFKQVADEISRILGLPEGERQAAVQQLLVNLDSLIPDDPVMAEVISEQMMAAFGAQIKKDPQGLQPISNKTVANAQSNWDIEDDPAVINECRVTDHLCRIHDKQQIEKLKNMTSAEMVAQGKTAIQKMLQDHQPVVDAFYRESLGPLDLEWGYTGTAENNFSDGWGVAKISKKHSDALMKLPEVIATGEIRKHPHDDRRVVILKGDTFAVFHKDENGHFLLTGMTADDRVYATRMRRGSIIETRR